MNERLGQLSKGRLVLAMLILTLSIHASLYLLDEHFGGIDIKNRMKIRDIILHYASPDKTFIIATHELTDMETLFDEILFLKEGRIALIGEADALREQYGTSVADIAKGAI